MQPFTQRATNKCKLNLQCESKTLQWLEKQAIGNILKK